MDAPAEILRVVLAPRDVFVLDDAADIRIVARSGCLWLTQAGDARDVVLNPGQSFTASHAFGVVISARREAEFVLVRAKTDEVRAQPTGWPRRLAATGEPRRRDGATFGA